MITYLAKEGFSKATYARAARQRAFTDYLAREVPGSVSFFTDIGGSSSTLVGSLGAVNRLVQGLRVVWSAKNPWVVVDYPNFPASVPRRLSVYLMASGYLSALLALCALRGSHLVVQADDDPALQDQWLGARLSASQLFWERRLERRLYRAADRLWFSADTAAEMMCSLFDVPLSRAVTVPNGAVAPADGLTRPDDGLFRFAYAGALLPDTHGVKGLMDAFKSVKAPHARLVLAGPEGDWIAAHMSRTPDDRVVYLGCLTAEEVQSVLSTCDAGVLTGQRGGYHDTGLPGKLGAYFAAGLPVVSTCGGEGARIIQTRHVGVVCDEQDLAQALDCLVDDTSAYAKMRANAMAAKEDYFWDRIYERAVAGLGVGPPGSGREELADAPHPEALASELQGGGL